MSELVIVASHQLNFSAISWWEQVNFQWNDDDEIHFVLDQHKHSKLDFYIASSLKQQSVDRHVAPFGHIILNPKQSVLALSLMLCA